MFSPCHDSPSQKDASHQFYLFMNQGCLGFPKAFRAARLASPELSVHHLHIVPFSEPVTKQ